MLNLARLFAALAAISASLTVMGYGGHIYALTRIAPGFHGMSILTAFVLIFLSVSVLATTAGRERIRALFAAFAALAILPVLLSYLTTGTDTLSIFLAVRIFDVPPEEAGRTAFATAISCLLLSVAMLSRRARPRITDVAAGMVAAISATGLLGYLYGVPDLYAFWVFNTMAVHTAASLLLLAIAAIFSAPGVGWSGVITSPTAGGSATRRQLSVLLIPPVMGWLLLSAIHQEKLSTGTAMALMVISMVWPLAVLILRDGRTLVALDNSRRGRAELQQRHAAELERKLSDQATALETASTDRLTTEAKLNNAQRMETLGQLTGGIAHDFNNLLMAISGNLQVLRRKLPKDLPEHRYVENAITATAKGAKVTGQLLAFSRSQRLSVEVIDLQQSMLNAQALIGNALGPGIHLRVSTEPDLWVNSDQDQLELSLLNLAVNARDAMPHGGTIQLASAATEDGQWVRIEMQDTGSGMAPDVLARATEPFFTTKERGKGTGLGLAQVHGFVAQCGGRLELDSTVGVGTTVRILLPRAAAPVVRNNAPSATPPHVAPSGTRRKAIVIDDDEAVRNVVVGALEDLGFEVSAAEDGRAGLAKLNGYRPDVAVIDFLMPGMNGAEVARAAQELHVGLPVVFVSGYSDTLALDGIADAIVLRKPFELADLERALIAVLDSDSSGTIPWSTTSGAPLRMT